MSKISSIIPSGISYKSSSNNKITENTPSLSSDKSPSCPSLSKSENKIEISKAAPSVLPSKLATELLKPPPDLATLSEVNAYLANNFARCYKDPPIYRNWIRTDFTGEDFPGANFKDLNLSELNFKKANLSGADFTNAKLYTRFEGGGYLIANFRGSKLVGANFENLRDVCEGKSLGNACFYGADLTGANLKGTTFYMYMNELVTHCINNHKSKDQELYVPIPTTWTLFGANYVAGADFRKAKLVNANMQQANLSHARFDEADLSGTDLRGAYVERMFSSFKRKGEKLKAYLLNQGAKIDENTKF